MSQAAGAELGSPQNNSQIEGSGADAAGQDRPPGLPTVEERVGELVEEYPDLAAVPLSTEDGRKVREELTDELGGEFERWEVEGGGSRVREEIKHREAVTVASGVRMFLEWYEQYRGLTLEFEKGAPWEVEYAETSAKAENSYHPEYAIREYAQLQALSRELTGGERPEGGGETEAAFEEPYIAFFSLTASSTPAEGLAPPVDHDRMVVDAWSGRSGVRKKLKYVFEERLGLDSTDWEYHRQGEPHAGGGDASGYRHDHPMVVFDAAEIDGEPTREDFYPVVEKHVEKCDWAGPEAHTEKACSGHERAAAECEDCQTPVQVRPAGEDGVENLAEYMAKYVSFGEEDLLEREIEYIVYGALQWATNSQKYTRSIGANRAIAADKCKQAAEDPTDDQDLAHGEEVTVSSSRGCRLECRACGSPWGIDQETTLAEHRLEREVEAAETSTAPELEGRWPSARSAARLDEAGVEGFQGPPEWRLAAVIDAEGERHPPVPGGPTMVRLKNPREDRPPPDAGGDVPTSPQSQQERRRALLRAAGGKTAEELLETVEGATERDLEALVERGDLVVPGYSSMSS